MAAMPECSLIRINGTILVLLMSGITMLLKIFQNKLFLYLGEHGPELDYIIGTTITDLTNLKNSASSTQLSPAMITKVIVGWNYLDAIFNFMFSISLFTNTTDYRYNYNVVKGIINVLGGIELFVFSYNPPLNAALKLKDGIALAGTAFAIGTAGDVICASIDFQKYYKEYNFPGWLDEQIKAYKYALAHDLDTKQLVKDIRNRCKAYINADPIKAHSITRLLNQQFSNKSDNQDSIDRLTLNLETVNSKNKIRDQWIQEQVEEAYKKNRTFLGVKIISMVGMTLLAVAGFLENTSNNPNNNAYSTTLTFGLALTTFVGCYYSLMNSQRLANQVGEMYHRFFPAQNEITLIELEEIRTETPNLN